MVVEWHVFRGGGNVQAVLLVMGARGGSVGVAGTSPGARAGDGEGTQWAGTRAGYFGTGGMAGGACFEKRHVFLGAGTLERQCRKWMHGESFGPSRGRRMHGRQPASPTSGAFRTGFQCEQQPYGTTCIDCAAARCLETLDCEHSLYMFCGQACFP